MKYCALDMLLFANPGSVACALRKPLELTATGPA
jgi:hypothetical protein